MRQRHKAEAQFMKTRSVHAAVCTLAILSLSACSINDRISEQEKTFKAKQAELEAMMNQKGKVVYATQDIPKGVVIETEALEEHEVEERRIPNDAMTSIELCAGRKARYPIGAGQIVGQADLAATKSE
jgi:flagella basal body P-ring formation protein FlgA